jgi:hypothetical protein
MAVGNKEGWIGDAAETLDAYVPYPLNQRFLS